MASDDLLPSAWLVMKRDMLASIESLWRLMMLVLVAAWAILPWRLGWRGVGTCVWITFWFGYGKYLPKIAAWMKVRIESP